MDSVMINRMMNTDGPRRKRRRKSLVLSRTSESLRQTNANNNNNQWKTDSEQQKYSSKLLQALRHVRKTSSSASASSKKDHLVIREAADRALAVTAKGKSRWSRAILKNRTKLKLFLKVANKPKVAAASTTAGRTRTRYSSGVRGGVKGKMNVAAVEKKGIVLGKLVPGCRKQPLAVVLDEAHDYISALEMQVRAMSALAQLLSVASGAVAPPPPPRP